jgi:prevent-host-death family protein
MEVAMKTEPETISVTDLRERTREILENAHFRGKRYVIKRAGQEMVVILGVEEYQRWLAQGTASQTTDVGRSGSVRR